MIVKQSGFEFLKLSDERNIQWIIFEEFFRQRLLLLQPQVKLHRPRGFGFRFAGTKWNKFRFFEKESFLPRFAVQSVKLDFLKKNLKTCFDKCSEYYKKLWRKASFL